MPRALWDGYREKLIARALSNQGWLVEIYTSRSGETWTITITKDGTACIVDAGHGMEAIRNTSAPETGA